MNYANDYSDGVRGVDTQRRGPVRLVAGGLASPAAVKRAALLCFAVGGLIGIVLAVAVDWRLVIVGAVSILAAGLYSGGPKPYASSGLGEVMVLVFFGFVATCGSAYVHLERVPWLAVGAGRPGGAAGLRHPAGQQPARRRLRPRRRQADPRRAGGQGPHPHAVPGQHRPVGADRRRPRARRRPAALVALLAAPLAVPPLRIVATKTDPPSLVQALIATARLQLVFSALLAAGLAL